MEKGGEGEGAILEKPHDRLTYSLFPLLLPSEERRGVRGEGLREREGDAGPLGPRPHLVVHTARERAWAGPTGNPRLKALLRLPSLPPLWHSLPVPVHPSRHLVGLHHHPALWGLGPLPPLGTKVFHPAEKEIYIVCLDWEGTVTLNLKGQA